MIIILRNLRVVLTRFKAASVMNIVGLSIAFAAFVIIMIQVNYELSFDRSYPTSDRLYRVEQEIDSTNHTWSPLMSRPMIDLCIAASPAIERGTLADCLSFPTYMTFDKAGMKVGFKENLEKVYPEAIDVFGYKFIEGSGDALKEPDKIIIPGSMAHRLFGDESALDRIVAFEEGVFTYSKALNPTYVIGGVYKDFSASSSILNTAKRQMKPDENIDAWGDWSYYAYVTLVPGASPEDVERAIKLSLGKAVVPAWAGGGMANRNIRLTPMKDLYYAEGMLYDLTPKGNRSTTMILLSIALLIVVVAGINFVNFATSIVPMRIKSINTQKVLGSPVATLRTVMVLEAVGIAMLSMLLAILWIDIASRAGISQWMLTPINITSNWTMVGYTALLALVTGLLSGLYPAFYATSFAPALVLKGSFGLSRSGRILRKGLIGFQFVVSIGLIIVAIFMHLQNQYLRSFNTGFPTDQVAVVQMGRDMVANANTITNKLKANASVVDVAYGQNIIGSSDVFSSWGFGLMGRDTMVKFIALPVSTNFCSVMGLAIIDGRDFTVEDEQRAGCYIFNERAQAEYNLTTEDRIDHWKSPGGAPIVGFVKDFNYATLRTNIEPMAFFTCGTNDNISGNLITAYIKVTGNPRDAVDHIRTVFREIDPAYPLEINFYDEIFNNAYQKERKTTALITLFSGLAVALSLIGVFGLVLFETQYRRKEIALRKVHGATVGQILSMFSGSFVRIVLICFVIAAPMAWVGTTEWLKDFPHRIELHWWVFALSLTVVMLVTMVTVVVQSWRAATTNPINSLKSE